MCIDASGTLYVSDASRIRQVSPNGQVTTWAGGEPGFADGPGLQARFNGPSGLAVNAAGDVFVADTFNQRIRKIAPDGTVSTLSGSVRGYVNGAPGSARFAEPVGLALDSLGHLLVADFSNNRIRKVLASGANAGYAFLFAGTGVAGWADEPVAGWSQFDQPYGLATNGNGNLYIADSGNHRIRAIAATGEVSTVAGSSQPGIANGLGAAIQFRRPLAVTVDPSNRILVADTDNHRIRLLAPATASMTLTGSSSGSVDGTLAEAQFDQPAGLAVGPNGTIYALDAGNSRIRAMNPGF